MDDDNNGFPDDVQGWDFFRHDSTPDDEVGHPGVRRRLVGH